MAVKILLSAHLCLINPRTSVFLLFDIFAKASMVLKASICLGVVLVLKVAKGCKLLGESLQRLVA